MKKRFDGGPAFPEVGSYDGGCHDFSFEGMTLRDYFAGQALAGLASDNELVMTHEKMSEWCYTAADAMLAAREVKP